MVIDAKELKGLFDTFEAAYVDTVSRFTLGKFIIQQILRERGIVNFLYPAMASA